jgi:SAM-dependent methyltransferase
MTTTTCEAADAVSAAQSLVRLNTAYTQSRVLQSAVEVGLFELLDAAPSTQEETCARLGLHPRLLGDFLDALVGLGLLSWSDGRYSNSREAARYLVPSSADYVGGGIARAAAHHYHMWGRLTEALRDGEPKSDGIGHEDAFTKTYQDLDQARRFLEHMDANNSFIGGELARCLDWTEYRTFVDVGGARGNVAAQIVGARPHLTGQVFDLPGVEPLFREHMSRLGITSQVAFRAGDFFRDPLPTADVVIFGHVLHDWSPEERRVLVHRAFPAVRPGGALVVYDQVIDDDRRDPQKLLQSLNVRLVRSGGSEYTVADVRGWAESAGFRFDRAVPLAPVSNDVAIVARKAG